MKNILFICLMMATQLMAFDQSSMQVIQISDKSNEMISGAKVELVGTGKVYYTNSKGECYIPTTVFSSAQSIKIDCISYKTVEVSLHEKNSKIILESR